MALYIHTGKRLRVMDQEINSIPFDINQYKQYITPPTPNEAPKINKQQLINKWQNVIIALALLALLVLAIV